MPRLTRREHGLSILAGAPLDYFDAPIPPARKKRKGLSEETIFQIECVTYYDKRCRVDRALREGTRLFAVSPNDGRRSMIQASIAKRMGQRAGVYDLHLLDKRYDRFFYYWIEAKAQKGVLTEEQQGFTDFLSGTPIKTFVIRTLDQFIALVGV